MYLNFLAKTHYKTFQQLSSFKLCSICLSQIFYQKPKTHPSFKGIETCMRPLWYRFSTRTRWPMRPSHTGIIIKISIKLIMKSWKVLMTTNERNKIHHETKLHLLCIITWRIKVSTRRLTDTKHKQNHNSSQN